MTKSEWKRVVYGGLATSLEGELDNASEWLFMDEHGEPISEADEKRMRAAVKEVADTLRAKGRRR